MNLVRMTAALLVWTCCATTVFAGTAAWTGQGPFGGAMRTVVVDPNAPSRLYASTLNGFFRSDDGGLSWRRAESGLPGSAPIGTSFALDPNVANALWIVDDSSRLYRSTDAGAHWTPTGDVAPGGPYTVSSLTAVAGMPGVLYQTNTGIGVRKSVDGGVTFTTLAGGLVGTRYVKVAADPADPSTVIALTYTDCQPSSATSRIYRSTDAGASWNAVVPTSGCNSSGFGLPQIKFGPAGSHRVYAQIAELVLRSNDDGASFSPTGMYASSIAVSPASADVLWLGVTQFGLGGFYDYVIEKSVDGGSTATPYATGMTTNGNHAPSVLSIAIHPDYPSTPRLWAGTYNAGIFQSTDDGASWSEHNDGLAAARIGALAVHPFDGTRIYAGIGDAYDPSQAFYRSNTVGSFVPSNSGLDAYHLRSIVIDPTTAPDLGNTVIYAVGFGADWVGGFPAHRNSGIYKSADGGLTWSTLSGGLPAYAADPAAQYAGILRSIALDPRSCAAPPVTGPCITGPLQIVYAAGSGVQVGGSHSWRIMKSSDGGANWASSENGLPADVVDPIHSAVSDKVSYVTSLVIDPVNPLTLYAGTTATARNATGASASPSVASGVFKSIDGGANWVHKSAGLPRYPGSTDTALDVLSVAIDPDDPQTLWATTINSGPLASAGQIYKSTDGADTWTLSNAGVTAPNTQALLVDPSNPSTVYAASGGLDITDPGGVYKSVDGGVSWHSISLGLPANAAFVLALDPADSRVLHAGTSGGVYTITQLPDTDHDGVPDLIENSGPNGGDADANNTADSAESDVSTTALGLLGSNAWQRGRDDSVEAHMTQLRNRLASGTVGGYFTVKLIDGDCTHSVDVAPVDAGPYGRDRVAHRGSFDYPRGLLRFELPQCTHATVDVTFNGANFGNGWSWRYFGPSTPGDSTTMAWHDASSVASSHTATTWRLQLAAGQFGSYRPTVAQSILFVGGPARNDTLFNDGFDD